MVVFYIFQPLFTNINSLVIYFVGVFTLLVFLGKEEPVINSNNYFVSI